MKPFEPRMRLEDAKRIANRELTNVYSVYNVVDGEQWQVKLFGPTGDSWWIQNYSADKVRLQGPRKRQNYIVPKE